MDTNVVNFLFSGRSQSFEVYLLFGLIVVALHAKENFDKPAFEISKVDPATLMIPRLISYDDRYVRGLLLYILAMCVFYISVSLVGPGVVGAIVALKGSQPAISQIAASTSSNMFNELHSETGTPHSQSSSDEHNVTGTAPTQPSGDARPPYNTHNDPSRDEPTGTPDQWPLIVALALTGLAPNIPGLKEPELIIRRIGHRVAAIPSYIRYVAIQMRKAPLNPSLTSNINFGRINLSFRPDSLSQDPLDGDWRKLCYIYERLYKFAAKIEIPEGARIEEPDSQEKLEAETGRISKDLHALDGELRKFEQAGRLDEERAEMEKRLKSLLHRSYLLVACNLTIFRVQDMSRALEALGFRSPIRQTDLLRPLLNVSLFMFLGALLVYFARSVAFPHYQSPFMPSSAADFLRYGTTIVIKYGISAYIALTFRQRAIRRGKWFAESSGQGTPLAYASVMSRVFFMAILVQMIITVAPQVNRGNIGKLSDMLSNSFLISVAYAFGPSVLAVLACVWLDKSLKFSGRQKHFASGSALVVGTATALTTFSFLRILGFPIEGMPLQILYDFLQALIVTGALFVLLMSDNVFTADYQETIELERQST